VVRDRKSHRKRGWQGVHPASQIGVVLDLPALIRVLLRVNLRLFTGTLIAFGYNSLVSSVPSRTIRRTFLRSWLSGFGSGTSVQCGCRFLNGRRVSLGARVVVNFGCLFDGRHYRIEVGDDASIGPEATILTLGHDPNARDFALEGGDVRIGRRAWIGYRAIVLPGVEIGEGAVVAAGAIVTRNVAPFTIVAGVPARAVGERRRDLSYQLDYAPWLM
jgi:acetyltransferase-like isoleucine patch superfamily enzyme